MSFRRVIGYVLPIPIILALFYILQLYPIVSQAIQNIAPFLSTPKEYVNLAVGVVVYVTLEKALERLLGGNDIEKLARLEAEHKHKLEEQSKSREQLNAKKQAHHKILVDSFFDKLRLLRIRYYPRSPFRLYLDASVGNDPVDPRLNFDELPNIPEARQHLEAQEYDRIKSQFDEIYSMVDSFNEEARKELNRLDLEGRLSREFPRLKAIDPYFPPGSSEFYYPDSFMQALEIAARSGEFKPEFTRWGDDFVENENQACNVLWLNDVEVARSRDKEGLKKFESVLREEAPAYASLLTKRDKILTGSLELQLSFRTAVARMLDDYRIREWLFGRCKVEDVLEDQEKVLSGL